MADENIPAEVVENPVSWANWVHTPGEWTTNACRYATKEEAEAAGNELLSRWYTPDRCEARPSNDPVNYRFDFEAYRNERIEP